MKTLTWLDRSLDRMESILLVFFLGAVVGLAFLQVVLRYFWAVSIPDGDVLARHLVLPASFMGAAVAASKGRHVGTDLISHRLGKRYGRILRAFICFTAGVVCWFLLEAAWSFTASEYEFLPEVGMHFQFWIGIASMPVGYGLLTVHFVIKGCLTLLEPGEE